MPNFNTYNNNQDRPITNTYSSVSFANGTSKIMPTRFSINYFNKVMSISIALRNNDPSEQIPRFDNEHQITVYVSYLKAKILHDAIVDMLATKKNNVCIELKNGLLKISNGIEYGSESPCFTITYADDKGKTTEVIYQTNTNYTAAYNYTGDSFSTMTFRILRLILLLWLLSSIILPAAMLSLQLLKRLMRIIIRTSLMLLRVTLVLPDLIPIVTEPSFPVMVIIVDLIRLILLKKTIAIRDLCKVFLRSMSSHHLMILLRIC